MANDIFLESNAERQAQRAEKLRAFGQLNLLHIKRQVALLLGMIGREGIFDQYTVHDISHIDKMLDSLDWIIPESTKTVMSPADYLMSVLSIYFHDMGMLVTRSEYEKRHKSDFPRYRDEVLFAGLQGQDYRAKVESLSSDAAERFLYQEFVRHKHAERIKNWVTGNVRFELGQAQEIVAEIDKLLQPLGEQFRRDLGLICESHHLDDLADLKKYKPSQPYADSDDETANLQYCAILLRTSDLLHVTMDRTPSISFRVINPTDPISQQEWAKQMAVKRLRPKVTLNAEGQPDDKLPKDTIEVHAYFTKADGFFGLNSYLTYTEGQLKKSNEWISTTKRLGRAQHEFHWRRIDDQFIETKGFLRDIFEFSIDQTKILDLLTGHTLYNDTQVVLRELCQNAIDAIRLQYFPKFPISEGHVRIHWDSKERRLSVADNGTGMTQSIISNFLLKVGTSRYQDADFKKEYPGFSSISRFGIGVLSAFMIADSVEILTCHPDEPEARQLILRSVHGKYLIQLLDKDDPRIQTIGSHGTQFSLRVRASIDMPSVLGTARLWLVVPGCKATVTIDDEAPVVIGHSSIGEALANCLAEQGIKADLGDTSAAPDDTKGESSYRVIERELGGVSVAYVVHWNEYFKEWILAPVRGTRAPLLLGTSIEGIRVEFSTPGFGEHPIYAMANVRGPNAPKTNVARSGLEATPERDAMLRMIYACYRDHASSEVNELTTKRSFSLTWATAEAKIILGALTEREGAKPISPRLFKEALEQLKIMLVEQDGRRSATAISAIREAPAFWTIDCALFHSAEPLIREAATSTSLAKVIDSLGLPDFGFPTEQVVCGLRRHDRYFGEGALTNREVSEVVVHPAKRRVDLKWVAESSPPRWHALPKWALEESRAFFQDRERAYAADPSYEYRELQELRIAAQGVSVKGDFGSVGVKAFGQTFLMPNTPVTNLLSGLIASLPSRAGDINRSLQAIFSCQVVLNCIGRRQIEDPDKLIMPFVRRWDELGISSEIDLYAFAVDSGLQQLVKSIDWSIFTPSAGARQNSQFGWPIYDVW